MNKQTQEALHKALKVLNCLNNDRVYETAWVKGAINSCEEALESQKQEPVACPYPCGWDNLYKITTEKGAYLVTHFDIDNPMPYSYWQEISSMVDTARTLVKWGMNIKSHPAPAWQGLSEKDLMRLIRKITRERNVKLNKIPFCTLFYDEINKELKEKNS